MASTDTIALYRGEAVTVNFTLDPVENISGWAIAFTASESVNRRTKLFSQAGAIVSAAAGTFKVDLSASQTDKQPQRAVYDVWRTDDGFARVLAIGTLHIQGVARLPTS
jgi:hypothetical protein